MDAQHDFRAAQLALHAQNTYDRRRNAHRSGKGGDTRSDAGAVGVGDKVADWRE